jgi:predicted small integral membrane protein
MILRGAKTALVFAVAFYYSLVVFNNLSDYDSNYQFVRHVLMMDSTFAGNHAMWRGIYSPAVHTTFYVAIIVWELVTTVLCWWGGARLALAWRESAAAFQMAKGVAIAGLTAGLLLWLAAFLSVGGEWFLMWQSRTWNGQEAAFQMFAVTGIVLVLLILPEAEQQP